MPEQTAPLDFVTLADAAYGDFVSLNASLIERLMPASRLFLYDLGGDSPELAALARRHRNLVRIPWPESAWQRFDWIDDLAFEDFHPKLGLYGNARILARRLRVGLGAEKKHGWIVDKREELARRKRFIHIVNQKPFCLLHALGQTAGPIAFLDADALLWRPFDARVDFAAFDLAVTLRAPAERKTGFNPGFRQSRPLPYGVVNAGVIFCGNSPATRLAIYEWIVRIGMIRCPYSEQTALALLVMEAAGAAPPDERRDLRLPLRGGGDARIATLPCELFNNVRPTLARAPAEQESFVLHFKGGRHAEPHFSELRKYVARHLDALGAD